MSFDDYAIRVDKISKRYRIGLKGEIQDSFAGAVFDFIKSPLRNTAGREVYIDSGILRCFNLPLLDMSECA